ncbi:MAG TPA: hypothetical protein VFJ72_07025 [Rubrobacteraceae bacterium]|nr:hypothetical protein [Rubrobacteraceae bacterium]
MRGLLCRCEHRLDATDDTALLGLVQRHFRWEHPTIPIEDETLEDIAATHTYGLEDVEAPAG